MVSYRILIFLQGKFNSTCSYIFCVVYHFMVRVQSSLQRQIWSMARSGLLKQRLLVAPPAPCRAEFHLVKIWVLNRTSQLIDSQYMLGRVHFRCITQVAYSELLVSENHRKPIWTSHLSWRHLMSLGVAICSFPHLKLGWLDYWFLDRYRNAEFGEHFSCNKDRCFVRGHLWPNANSIKLHQINTLPPCNFQWFLTISYPPKLRRRPGQLYPIV